MSSARVPAVFGFLLLVTAPLCATAEQQLRAQKLSSAPDLDGEVLAESVWSQVTPSSGFTQVRPFAGRPASQKTEVRIGFTDDTLYVGVVCYDDAPDEIIFADSRRDADLDDTDSFRLIFDVFDDGQNGFVFGTTPSSVEFDAQVAREGSGGFRSGGAVNENWDTSWSVQAKVSEIGWSAEMAIPFSSLRYGAGPIQTWGVNFQRNIRRNNEVAYWAPLPRQYNLYRVSEAGSLLGLEPPAQRSLRVTPYVLGQVRRGGALDGTDVNEEVGFDAKFAITPSLTLDLTYNTDFAQVEADDIQVNLDRFSLFFPEKRPFFLENAGQFSVGSPRELELFFSRRIGVGADGVQQPIDGGLRLSGKVGRSTNVGLLYMQTEAVSGIAAGNDFTVLRVNQELPNRSALGAMFVGRQGDGSIDGDKDSDRNGVYAVDGKWGIGQNNTITGYVAKSETPGRRGDDLAYNLNAGHSSTEWNHSIGYTKVGANFNPEVGFLRRTDYERAALFSMLRYRPENLWGLHELRPHYAFRGFWDGDGFYESGFLHVDNHWEWRNGIEIHTGVNFTHEGVKEPFEINEGTFVLPDDYDHKEVQLVFQTDAGRPVSIDSTLFKGGFFGGDRVNWQNSVAFRHGDKFTSELTWDYNDIDLPVANGKFEVNVARLRLSYSFSPKILLQALVQYDDRSDLVATNLRFSWLQSANAGLYLVYNEVDDDTVRGPIKKRREFTLKYSRIFDVL